MATAGAALRLRLIYRMLRVGELLALAVILSWSSSRVPSAAAAAVRFGGSLLLNPRFVFVLGNAIVLLLLALSRRDPSLSSSSSSNHAVIAQTPTAPPAVSFRSFTTPTPMPAGVTEATAAAAAPQVVIPVVIPAAAPTTTVFEEDRPAVRVISKARAPRRSRSEKMGPRGGARRAASPELRRSESDNGRRRRSSATARDAEGRGRWAGMDDAEEFRRTVEAFIAKQTRFHREEESMAVDLQVSPAVAGALVVVE